MYEPVEASRDGIDVLVGGARGEGGDAGIAVAPRIAADEPPHLGTRLLVASVLDDDPAAVGDERLLGERGERRRDEAAVVRRIEEDAAEAPPACVQRRDGAR